MRWRGGWTCALRCVWWWCVCVCGGGVSCWVHWRGSWIRTLRCVRACVRARICLCECVWGRGWGERLMRRVSVPCRTLMMFCICRLCPRLPLFPRFCCFRSFCRTSCRAPLLCVSPSPPLAYPPLLVVASTMHIAAAVHGVVAAFAMQVAADAMHGFVVACFHACTHAH